MDLSTNQAIKALRTSGLIDSSVFTPVREGLGGADESLESLYLKDKDNWSRRTSALFDGHYYLSKYQDVSRAGINPLLHYIRHGYLECRNPSPLVDIKYILMQLVRPGSSSHHNDNRDAECAMLRRYDGLRDLLIQTRCDPSPFFSNDYYRRANKEIVVEGAIPLEDYIRRKGRGAGRRFLECSTFASFNYYMKKYPDLAAAQVIPLLHLMQWGLREGRRFSAAETVRPEFLRNTALLFADKRLGTLSGMLESGAGKAHLPGPFWPTPYTKDSIPALSHVANEHRRAAFIGVVLFKNSDAELLRLQQSIEHEIRHSDCDIEVMYIANDGDVDRYRAIVGDGVSMPPGGENVGFGRAHNNLMTKCFERDRLYIGANPDGYFVPGCIDALVNFSDYFEGRALVEASAMPIDHPKWHDPLSFDTHWVSGACFALSPWIWSKVKGFDEKIHLYCEDVDLSWRVRLSGGELKVCPTARYMHDVTPRFYKLENDEVASARRLSMLKGAYYLARKWGAKEKARSYLQKLELELAPSELACLNRPDVELDPTVVCHIADFDHERFAPSRFWK